MTNLKKLSVTDLLKLRDDVDKMLHLHRSELEMQLSRLSGGNFRKNGRLKGQKVAPKYRSLQDPNLVWSGRGGRAKWLTAEMKATKKPIDSFLIQ